MLLTVAVGQSLRLLARLATLLGRWLNNTYPFARWSLTQHGALCMDALECVRDPSGRAYLLPFRLRFIAPVLPWAQRRGRLFPGRYLRCLESAYFLCLSLEGKGKSCSL
jgi:hypothetical protein